MTYEKFNEDDDSPEQFTIVWGDNPTQIEVRTPALEERSYKEWLGRFFSRVYEGLPVEGNLKLPEDSNEYVTLGGHKSITPNDDDFDAISSAQFTSGGANMMALFRGVMKKESSVWRLRTNSATLALRFPAGTSPVSGFEVFTERILTLDPEGYTFNVGVFERNHYGDLADNSFGYFMDGHELPRSSNDPLANQLFEQPARSTFSAWSEVAPMAEFCLDQCL